MKNIIKKLSLIIFILILSGCSGEERNVILKSCDDTLTSIKCELTVEKNYLCEEQAALAIGSWEKWYVFYPDSKNYSGNFKLVVGIATKNSDYKSKGKDYSIPKVDDFLKYLKENNDCFKETETKYKDNKAIYVDLSAGSESEKFLYFYTSNDKQDSDEYYGIYIYGTYVNDNERDKILKEIESLNIVVS